MKAYVRACAILLISVFGSAAMAAGLPEPEGRTVLQVAGEIENTTDGKVAEFDLKQLEGLGTSKIVTTTPWFDGKVEFEGVPLEDVFEAVGGQGKEIEVVALNDYKATIPVEDLARYRPILATRMGGELMSVRDKGPLFVIYPYDAHDDLKNHKFYSRSVWQVYRIVVR